jgi:hypothetical protein
VRVQVVGRFLTVLLAVQAVTAAVLTWCLVELGRWGRLPENIYRNSPDALLLYNNVREWVLREEGFIVALFFVGVCYVAFEWSLIRESAKSKGLALASLIFVPAFLLVAYAFR